MSDVNKTAYFYRVKFAKKEARLNCSRPLRDYFGPLIGECKRVRIADVGAGPICTIGNEWPGVELEIAASDVMQPEYEKLWRQHGKTPLIPVTYEDFEQLSYADESFDVVHCANALDHTDDALQALLELQRICKRGGWIYLRHAPDQMKRYRGMHRWNISYDNGECRFDGQRFRFKLPPQFATRLEGKWIISTYRRTGDILVPLREEKLKR